jgi:hypothetical protein
MERLPYRATQGAESYDHIQQLRVIALLESVRSLYNVARFFVRRMRKRSGRS